MLDDEPPITRTAGAPLAQAPATAHLIEPARRGPSGWRVFAVAVFWGWHVLCVVGLVRFARYVGDTTPVSEFERLGVQIGAIGGVWIHVGAWWSGAVLLALCVLMTRGAD